MKPVQIGTMTDAEIRKMDFAWAAFYQSIISFEMRCRDLRQQGKVPTFSLVDHQNGRLTER